MMKSDPPTSSDYADLISRLRRVMEPTRIFLFGSCARDEFRPEGDIDVLVVVPDGVDLLEANMEAYRQVRGFPYAVDILYVNESHLRRHANTPGFVYREVMRDGREIYATT